MTSGRKGSFELTLGRIGITIITLGIAVLLFASFMSGVLVGRNIDSYPEKIARGIPSTIKEKMASGVESVLTGHRRDTAEVPLTFYQTLSRSKEEPTPPLPQYRRAETQGPGTESEPATPRVTPEQPRETPGAYTIQVAAFRDRPSAERLRDRLAASGHSSVIHESRSSDQGTWYRLRIEGFESREAARREAASVESAIQELTCLILKN